MNGLTANLRKAAIFLRSLDPETAASLLARLSREEAEAVRKAIQSLGDWDSDEQDDVASEFRRVGPIAAEAPQRGVELNFSPAAVPPEPPRAVEPRKPARPFDFLEQARVEALVPYLSREHSQTVAVVLSYLQPKRAADVLAALPSRLQTEAVARMTVLGETDPNSLQVLEQELAEWVKRQNGTHAPIVRHTDAVAAMLAAADASVRNTILSNVMQHDQELARRIAPRPAAVTQPGPPQVQATAPPKTETAVASPQPSVKLPPPAAITTPTAPRPRIQIDDLARMDKRMLGAVLRSVDAELLVLALAGASDALVDRIASQMPRPAAKAFRKRLGQIGPTRLRDVEAAQQEIVHVAAGIIQARRSGTYSATASAAAHGR